MKEVYYAVILQGFWVSVFFLVAFATLFFAYGYRFDVKASSVLKTSIIDIVSEPEKARVYLNGALISEEIPYQIKGVQSGFYDLRVEKNGFQSWERKITVRDDVVSIVPDVLLLAEDFGLNARMVKAFSGTESLYFGDNSVLSDESNMGSINLFSFIDANNWSLDTIGLKRDDVSHVDVFPDRKFLFHFSNGFYAYVDYLQSQYKYFRLGDGLAKVLVDAFNKDVYYLKAGQLYKIAFKDLDDESFDKSKPVLFLNDIEDFDLDYRGNIYYVSLGKVYYSHVDGGDIKLLQVSVELNKNIAYHPAKGDYGLLIVRSRDEFRRLFVADSVGNLTLVAKGLDGDAYVNDSNEVIYATDVGRLFVYDIYSGHKRFIEQTGENFELLGWGDTNSHFVYSSGSVVKLSDIYKENIWTLADNVVNPRYFPVNEGFVYFSEGMLKAVSLNPDEEKPVL